jgi:class 3 adenylate cyclase
MTEETLFDALNQAAKDDLGPDEIETRMWDRFGRTCAMLVLDCAGFSRTTQKRGVVHYLAQLVRMRALCDPIFQDRQALSWRAYADDVYAEFVRVDQAVRAALDIHRALRRKRLLLDDKEILTACIGIGYGRVLVAGPEGVFGDQMNLASKLGEDLAQGGETLLTEDAFLHLDDRQGMVANRRLITLSGVEIPYFSVTED